MSFGVGMQGLVQRVRCSHISIMTKKTAFDTQGCVKRMTAGGFTKQQAEALAELYTELFNANLAIKGDVAEVENPVETIKSGPTE